MELKHRIIVNIAFKGWNKDGGSMTYEQLKESLKNFYCSIYKTNRGLASGISAAYRKAVKENNQGIADCIANFYVNYKGEHVWKNSRC